MPVELSSIGNVEPISTVAVKAQVSGELLEVHFKEGDFVRKGQLLFTIDSRSYQGQVGTMQANIEKDQAQLKQTEANVARDTAQFEYAQSVSKRYATLLARGLIATDSSEQVRSQANALEESVRADRAAIDNVRAILGESISTRSQLPLPELLHDLLHCGRPTGAVMMKPGNHQAGRCAYRDHQSNQSIYVNFTVPAQSWPDIKKHEKCPCGSQRPQDPAHPAG